ncbi:hypothetical protein F3Y22_tig00111635pilonHSYRG00004 [Hibiscus syriacus]|uniref:Uncharacterized protein n=1 Tax=Hibiscus syriacus TaxID=106335 RepID=A0A6A2XJM1_HIBSY|nr:hypothetical protein F3Y22_tig00111635pilonHSYRG00004 [Hibiscus syriacus]
MGANAEFQVPVIEFLTGSSDLERGTKGWHHLCKRLREACETYGCFQVVYEGVSQEIREDTFALLKQLVEEVPLERRQNNVNPKPNHGFIGPCSDTSFETIHTIVKQMEELNSMIWLMIIDSYGLGKKWESVMIDYKMLLRMMKYKAPPPEWESGQGLHYHSDKPVSTIICDDLVSGLEIEVDNSQWIKFSSSPSSFLWSETLSWCI